MRQHWPLIALATLIVISVALMRVLPSNIWNTRNNLDKEVVACSTNDFSGDILNKETLGFFEGKNLKLPEAALAKVEATDILGTASPDEKWIEVDLSDQKIKAWDGTDLFLESLVSTGYGPFKTPTGEFRIWIKLRATKMEGGSGSGYYYLPNVPYVMFFGNSEIPNYRGYGLHGTYWHNDFGTPRSHGCVNLPTNIAKDLYYWTTPTLLEGKGTVYSDEGNIGTRIVIHE